MTFFKPLLLVAVLFTGFLPAAEPPSKRLRLDECYHVWTGPATEALDEAKWMIFDRQGRFDASPDTAAAVLDHYRKQDPKLTKHGLIVFSNSHSIPDTREETKTMNPQLTKLYRLKEWREAENKLVADLVAEANKQGVPVWINLTRFVGNRLATFQLLTDPKLTLKK
ncbi:MAG: hypothetical protein RIS79_2132 [Verrucomicrobiota bacterium]|jgi:hypothetical protein